MILILLALAALVLFSILLYKWMSVKTDHFASTELKYLKCNWTGSSSTQPRTTGVEYSNFYYNSFPKEKIYGFYNMFQPTYFVRDLDLIKQIAVKDFDHFQDHVALIDEQMDALFGNSLFMMKGQKWRDMRATLSPAFTGSKMRQMFELVCECTEATAKYFQQRADRGEIINCEMKNVFARCATDIIASCAYGIKVDSLEDEDNDFFYAGKSFMNSLLGVKGMLKFMFMKLLPNLARILDVKITDKRVTTFFRSMVFETMAAREKDNIQRPDMIDILMHVRNGAIQTHNDNEKVTIIDEGFATVEESEIGKATVKRQWTDTEIVAQCFLFFIGGFDSSSNLLTFVAYELARHPDIQNKLFEEIQQTNEMLNGQHRSIDYDTLQKMKYMDMVISEVLRMWPPAPLIDRECVKDYHFDDGELKFHIKKGEAINIPAYSIQNDPDNFSDPKTFDPERFSDVNKSNIKPGTFMPFGVGPRNCIGSRFALMQAKSIIYHLILNFSFEPNDKTVIPMKLKKIPVGIVPDNGLHLQLKPRN